MTTLNLQVAASADDSSTALLHFSFDNTAAASTLGNSGGNTGEVWSRFTNVTVPQGTTITSATIEYWNVAGHGSANPIKIKTACENTDNSTAPTTGDDANGRTMTAYITWADFGPSVDNTLYTLDITAAVQTVINRAGWASGNAIGVRSIDNGSTGNANLLVRNWDNDPANAAQLVIVYTPAIPPVPVRTVSAGQRMMGTGGMFWGQ